jgi:hypothetical protein
MHRGLCLLGGLLLAGAAAAGPPGPGKKPQPAPEEQGEGVTLTVYNQNFVVVRERRLLELKRGRGDVRFREVAATIVPETVLFSVPGKPDAARVVEQSYEYDLVSAAKLLDRYIDREIAVVTRDGGVLKGKLLSFDDSQLVLQTPAGVDLVPRGDNVRDVRFSALPEGLLTRPTLVWRLDARAGGKQLVKVAYAAGRMTWRVDYRARVNKAGDRMDLAGWVTVTNNTGTAFRDARLRLMAGDLNLVENESGFYTPALALVVRNKKGGGEEGKPNFAGQAFAEYHLYELGRKTTLKDSATKQIELLDVGGIPITRAYELRPSENRVTVLLEFRNDKKLVKGLGIPLPKGPVRVFQQAQDGALELAGVEQIDHTPKDEKVRLRLGYAFDLTARRKTVATRDDKQKTEYDMEIRLRNHKKVPVTVDVVEAVNGRMEWQLLKQNQQFTKRDVNTLVFPVAVQPNTETVLTYAIRYTKEPPAQGSNKDRD